MKLGPVEVDFSDIVDSYGIDLSKPEPLFTRNMYSPLADMMDSRSPDVWRQSEYEVTGHISDDLSLLAASIMRSEHAQSQSKGNVRLNSTTPDCPETADILGLKKAETKGAPGVEAPKEGKKQFTKAERRAAVLSRVVANFGRYANKELSFLQWLLMSSATPAWKLAVFEELFPSGSVDYNGGRLGRNFISAVIIASCSRYRPVSTDEELALISALRRSMAEGATFDITVDGFACLTDDCSSWLSGYQLYRQGASPQHSEYLAFVSAFRSSKQQSNEQ